MASLTLEEREAREARVKELIKDGYSLGDIAGDLGITRQAAWEFCARRGWLDVSDAKAEQYKHRLANK